MKYIKYILVFFIPVFLSACNTTHTEFVNKNDENNGMIITVNHNGDELKSVQFEIENLVPKEQAAKFVQTDDENFNKKDLKQLEELYTELNQFEGVDTKTKVTEEGDNVRVKITGNENIQDGKSTIGHTESGGTFEEVREFLTEQGFKEK